MFGSLLLPAARRTSAPSYTAHPVDYDSAGPEYMVADSTIGTSGRTFVAVIIMRSAASNATDGYLFGHNYFGSLKNYSNSAVNIWGKNSSGTTVLDTWTHDGSGTVPNEAWKCIMCSRTGTTLQLYVGDTSCVWGSTTNNDDDINFGFTNIGIGARSDAATPYNGTISFIGVALGQTLDLSVQSNRRKFFDDNGIPVDPRDSGLTWDILIDHAAATVGTNDGSGPDFTVTGTPSDSSFTPVDVL